MNDTYQIRFAKLEDADRIVNFIYSHWDENHIFFHDRSFFEYEFIHDNHLNFVVAEDNKHNLLAIEGFIKYTQTMNNSDIQVVMWCAKKNIADPFLGVKLLNFIASQPFRSISSCGINDKTIPIYRYLGYQVGELNHYYQLHPRLEQFKIAKVDKKKPYLAFPSKQWCLKKIASFSDLVTYVDVNRSLERKPYKDAWYINKRYFNHPVYHYDTYLIVKHDRVDSFFVGREIKLMGSTVFRIVDFIGDVEDLCGIGNALQNLMIQHNYEYIDFYQYGIADYIMQNANFSLRTPNDLNIIPNYFEPFLQQNIPILFFTNQEDSIFLFKGDGDQDRPNKIVTREVTNEMFTASN